MKLKEIQAKQKIDKCKSKHDSVVRQQKKHKDILKEVKPKDSEKRMGKKKFKVLMSRFDNIEAKRKKQIKRMRKKKQVKDEKALQHMFK